MGKKRIATKKGTTIKPGVQTRTLSKLPKKKVSVGTLHVKATFNNTYVSLSDNEGNLLTWSSSGALGFKGAKKGTPFAAAKVGELLGEKAKLIGIKEVDVVIKGVGAGRESAIRSFVSKGIKLNALRDKTPIPHNGPRPPRPRRV